MTEVLDAPVPGAIVTTPVEVTTADVLVRAADLLEEFGWTQGSRGMAMYHSPEIQRRYCLVGAVAQVAVDLLGLPDLGYSAATVYLECDAGDAYCWNDAEGRTKAEVVARLREAATRAREGASK